MPKITSELGQLFEHIRRISNSEVEKEGQSLAQSLCQVIGSSMTDIPFDTLAAVKKLKAQGVNEAQAEAFAEVVRDGIKTGVANKSDITELKQEMKELKQETKELKRETKELKRGQERLENAGWVLAGLGGAVSLGLISVFLTEILPWMLRIESLVSAAAS